jgi:hypothetical protein
MFLLLISVFCLFGALTFGALKIVLKHVSFIIPFGVCLHLGLVFMGWWAYLAWQDSWYSRLVAGVDSQFGPELPVGAGVLWCCMALSQMNFFHDHVPPRWLWVVLASVLAALPAFIWCACHIDAIR